LWKKIISPLDRLRYWLHLSQAPICENRLHSLRVVASAAVRKGIYAGLMRVYLAKVHIYEWM